MEDLRAQYIKAMRVLLDVLESNPSVPLPYEGRETALMLFCHDAAAYADTKAAFGGVGSESPDDSGGVPSEVFVPVFGANLKIFHIHHPELPVETVSEEMPF